MTSSEAIVPYLYMYERTIIGVLRAHPTGDREGLPDTLSRHFHRSFGTVFPVGNSRESQNVG